LVTSSDSGGAMRKHSPSGATAQCAIPELTLMDTCDQCGAAACVRVAVTDAQHLDFCECWIGAAWPAAIEYA
jgi:hypothetical protein